MSDFGICVFKRCLVRGERCEWQYCPEHCRESHVHGTKQETTSYTPTPYEPAAPTLVAETYVKEIAA